MKQLIVIITSIVMFIGACSNSNPSSGKMRRFVFASLNPEEHIDISQLTKSGQAYDLLKENGLVYLGNYKYDSINLVVVDMEENFDYKRCMQLVDSLSEEHQEIQPLSKIICGEYKLIDRIYKMEQKNVYAPGEGQLIPKTPKNSVRFVLTLEIINQPVLAAEYVAQHAPGKAWPEITQNMKTVGIKDMELYKTAYRVFLIMDTKADFSWDTDGERWGTLPREKEWQAYMAKYQKADPESQAAEKWKSMILIE